MVIQQGLLLFSEDCMPERMAKKWSDAKHETRHAMRRRLRSGIATVKRSRIEEICKPARTISRRMDYVLNA